MKKNSHRHNQQIFKLLFKTENLKNMATDPWNSIVNF